MTRKPRDEFFDRVADLPPREFVDLLYDVICSWQSAQDWPEGEKIALAILNHAEDGAWEWDMLGRSRSPADEAQRDPQQVAGVQTVCEECAYHVFSWGSSINCPVCGTAIDSSA